MDWQTILSQGTAFWAATAAIAGGLTLAGVTIALRLRGLRRRHLRLPTAALRAAAAYGAAPPSPATAVEAAPAAVRAGGETPATSLALLLRRLQLAGDRLEDVSRALADEPALEVDNPLKAAAADVEYVFRACSP